MGPKPSQSQTAELFRPRLDEQINMQPPLVKLAALTFEAPRGDDFPCLGLARQALCGGASHTVVLNAANEVAVDLFLTERLAFLDIPAAIAAALDAHAGQPLPDVATVADLDARVRRETADWAARRR